MTTASMAGENFIPGRAEFRGIEGWDNSCENISRGVFAVYGRQPVSRKYAIVARLYWSAAGVTSSPDSETRAEEAFQRALTLNPHLSIAHKFYANLEADIGEPIRAIVRLLKEANRHGNDPELFAGLVHACRYCGLFDESIAAHAEARRLDPNIPTSLEQTLLMASQGGSNTDFLVSPSGLRVAFDPTRVPYALGG